MKTTEPWLWRLESGLGFLLCYRLLSDIGISPRHFGCQFLNYSVKER